MISLDMTVVNVALPTIQRELHFSQSSLAWVVDAYLVTFGGFLLLAGRIGDLVGPKKVFVSGVVLFTLASAFCGLSNSQAELIVGRFIQGAASAVVAATLLGFVVTMFPEPRARARAFGFYGFCGSSGGAIGLIVGGAITQALNWHWVFLINLPIGVAILVFGTMLIDERSGLGIRRGIDVVGALLVTAASMLLIYAIVQSGETGWGSAMTMSAFGGTIVLAGIFLVLQMRLRHPILPLRLFQSRNLNTAVAVRTLMPFGAVGEVFIAGLYLQHVRHYSPLLTGLAFLPLMLSIALFSLLITARLVTKLGAKAPFMLGALMMCVGSVLLARVALHGNYFVGVFPGFFLVGSGFGLSVSPSMALAMDGALPSDTGVASGIANVSYQIGSAIAVALQAAVSTSRTNHLLGEGASRPESLVAGYHLAFLLGAGCSAGVLFIALMAWRDRHLGREHGSGELALVVISESEIGH